MLWQLLALHLEVSYFEMQPPQLIHYSFMQGPHNQLKGGSKNQWDSEKKKEIAKQYGISKLEPVYSSLSATSHFLLPSTAPAKVQERAQPLSSSVWFRRAVKLLFFIQNLGKPGVEDPQTVLPGTAVRYPASSRYSSAFLSSLGPSASLHWCNYPHSH